MDKGTFNIMSKPNKYSGDTIFKGILLNEPYKDYGVHRGEKIFFLHHKIDEEFVLITGAQTNQD